MVDFREVLHFPLLIQPEERQESETGLLGVRESEVLWLGGE